MTEFWMGLALGACFGYFMGLLTAGLLRFASDAEIRLMHHTRETDEHAEGLENESQKGN